MPADEADIEIELDDFFSNSGLFGDLEGDQAQQLMNWGEAQILRFAERYEGDQFMDQCAEFRRLVKLINQFVGLRGKLEADRVEAVWSGMVQQARSLGYNFSERLIHENLPAEPNPEHDLPMVLRELDPTGSPAKKEATPKMKIGVTQWTLDQSGVEAVGRAAELGFDVMQIDYGQFNGEPPLHQEGLKVAYQEAAKAAGIEVIGVAANLFNDVSLIDPEADHTALILKMVNTVDGFCDFMYIPSFNASEMKTDADMQSTAHWLNFMCDIATPLGITIATENTLNGEQQLRLLEMVDHPALGVFIDTQNPVIWGHNTAEIVQTLQANISRQFHAKDGINGEMGNARLGAGDANFSETLDTIISLNIAGTWISENEYGEDAEARAKADIEFIRTCYTEQS